MSSIVNVHNVCDLTFVERVNLGGWLNTEPFISPALYEKYANGTPVAIDEWTLSQNMRADTSSGGGISQLEDHYKTFIVRCDIPLLKSSHVLPAMPRLRTTSPKLLRLA